MFLASMVLPRPCAPTSSTLSGSARKSSARTRSRARRSRAVGQSQSQSAIGLKRPRRAAVRRRSTLRRCRSSSARREPSRAGSRSCAQDGGRRVYAAHGHPRRFLLVSGADADAVNEFGATPLWLAAMNGRAAMVARVLEVGADPNAALKRGETPLMTAARSGRATSRRAVRHKPSERKKVCDALPFPGKKGADPVKWCIWKEMALLTDDPRLRRPMIAVSG